MCVAYVARSHRRFPRHCYVSRAAPGQARLCKQGPDRNKIRPPLTEKTWIRRPRSDRLQCFRMQAINDGHDHNGALHPHTPALNVDILISGGRRRHAWWGQPTLILGVAGASSIVRPCHVQSWLPKFFYQRDVRLEAVTHRLVRGMEALKLSHAVLRHVHYCSHVAARPRLHRLATAPQLPAHLRGHGSADAL